MTSSIPAGWSRTTIGDLATVSRGASPRPIASARWFSDMSEVGWVRIADLGRSDGLTLRTTTQRLSSDGIARSRLLPPGTLIMSIAATVGLPIVTGIPACIHDGFVAIERLRSVDRTFLLYALKALEPEFRGAGQTGSQANVNTSIVNGTSVLLPPEPEQLAIAAALADADRQISALLRLIAKKDAIKQGMLQQLLAGKTRLPGFTEPWISTTTGSVGTFKGGSGFPGRFQGAKSGKYPFFKVSDMNSAGNELFMSTAINYVGDTQRRQMGAVRFPKDAIVFAKVGAAIFLERKRILAQTSCIDNNMAAMAVDLARADVRFIHYALMNFAMSSLVATTALPSLNAGQLRSIPLSLPTDLAEQRAIAEVLKDSDDQIRGCRAQLTKAQAMKQGMMQQLLTGETRLAVAEVAA